MIMKYVLIAGMKTIAIQIVCDARDWKTVRKKRYVVYLVMKKLFLFVNFVDHSLFNHCVGRHGSLDVMVGYSYEAHPEIMDAYGEHIDPSPMYRICRSCGNKKAKSEFSQKE